MQDTSVLIGRPLRKELGLRDVYVIATGATLSAGLFLLPGLAAAQAGPAIVACYMIAALPMIPAMLSVVELATAMPRAGGAYYFLDRSIGPAAGTVGGLGIWLALTLKTAFALVGMGAYLALFFPKAPVTLVACCLAITFGAVNLLGAGRTGSFQRLLVVGLLTILAWFIVEGVPAIQPAHFSGFFDAGFQSVIATSGLVYISYVGITNVASVSEEVKDPERNLPLGIFLALATAVAVYALCTTVMVGVVPGPVLASSLTPMAETATRLVGRWGGALVTVAALLAFSSVANAGILSASRYPLAMGRDQLLPAVFRNVSPGGIPVAGVLVSVTAIVSFVLLMDPIKIAKLASAFQLLMFALLCFAVIVMRESGIDSYDPGYRAPLYPWLQIAGMLAPIWLIFEMGRMPLLFTFAVVGAGFAWYFYYARMRVERHGAIYHVFERLGKQRYYDLDRELRGILKEKGVRADDPIDHVIATAWVIDVDSVESFEEIVSQASSILATQLALDPAKLRDGILEGTRTGATPVAGGAALPHMRVPGLDTPRLLVARCRQGLRIETGDAFGEMHRSEPTYAFFFLVSPDDDAGQHLRMLAHLASRVDEEHFVSEWRAARDEHALTEVLLRHERYVVLRLTRGSQREPLIDRPLGRVDLPDGCLVAVIRREDRSIVPRGGTTLREGDVLTVIGEAAAIHTVRERFGSGSGSGSGL